MPSRGKTHTFKVGRLTGPGTANKSVGKKATISRRSRKSIREANEAHLAELYRLQGNPDLYESSYTPASKGGARRKSRKSKRSRKSRKTRKNRK